MSSRSLGLTVGVATLTVTALVGCSSKPKAPPRDALVAQLQQEAEALKAENENKDTDLGVKTTWRIMSVDVTEQPDDEKAPWRGTIVFKIRSETSDMGRHRRGHEFEQGLRLRLQPHHREVGLRLQALSSEAPTSSRGALSAPTNPVSRPGSASGGSRAQPSASKVGLSAGYSSRYRG